jgi:hypothetical protein
MSPAYPSEKEGKSFTVHMKTSTYLPSWRYTKSCAGDCFASIRVRVDLSSARHKESLLGFFSLFETFNGDLDFRGPRLIFFAPINKLCNWLFYTNPELASQNKLL